MKELPDYSDFERIYHNSKHAAEYAMEHYHSLLQRHVTHILYGIPSVGPGAFCPSRRIIRDSERKLSSKTRRKRFHEYAFDSENKILHATERDSEASITGQFVFFDIDDTQYVFPFINGMKAQYSHSIYSIQYKNGKPVQFTIANDAYVYVEYYHHNDQSNGVIFTDCTWYQYFRTRRVSERGIPLDWNAPLGAPNSPVEHGHFSYEAIY